MAVIVTGSSGQIGSFVVDALQHRSVACVGLDLHPSRWTSRTADIRDPAALDGLQERPPAVVHLAAQISVQRSIQDPREDLSHNLVGTLNLLEACRRLDIARFVFVSSAAVYGVPSEIPVDEDHSTLPLSPYGAGKVAAEHYVRLYGELYGISTVAVRPFNVYSGRQDPGNPYSGVMSRFAARAVRGHRLTIFGAGTQTRDFVHATDVADWLVRLALDHRDARGVMNLGTGTETTIADLARMVLEAAGRPQDEIEHADPMPGEIPRSVASILLATKLGFRPRISLKEGIPEVLAAERRRHSVERVAPASESP